VTEELSSPLQQYTLESLLKEAKILLNIVEIAGSRLAHRQLICQEKRLQGILSRSKVYITQ
jgi:hypothetical protein